MNGDWGISYEIALRWMPLDLTDDKPTLVQVMAWCRQATSHYLSQCWPSSLSPYGVTCSQWVNGVEVHGTGINSYATKMERTCRRDLYNQSNVWQKCAFSVFSFHLYCVVYVTVSVPVQKVICNMIIKKETRINIKQTWILLSRR